MIAEKEMSAENIAVLLLGFGAPEKVSDVARFMKNLTGRDLSPERLALIEDKYKQIGGGSPLLKITRRQAVALAKELKHMGHPMPVEVGMCYMDPLIKDAVADLCSKGFNRLIGVSMSAQHSRVTTGAYINRFRKAVRKHKCENSEISEWTKNIHYLKALAGSISDAITIAGADAPVIFSAHSVPKEHVETGDTYLHEIGETIEGLEGIMGVFRHELAFQSRGGPGAWLEPTTDEVIERLAREGVKSAVIVAISFISDHMESLYDIDIIYKQKASELGMRLIRAKSLNDSPGLIKAIAESIAAKL